MDEARDVQASVKDKRDWAGAIDEQIAGTLLAAGAFHADDLDELGVPPEHANTKGLRIGSFSRRKLMESTGVYRTVSHAAANARKAPVYRITEKGRQELSKLVGHRAGAVEDACSVSGESSAGGRGQARKAHALVKPEPLSLLPEPPKMFDVDQRSAA
jgi:hypothetical protein